MSFIGKRGIGANQFNKWGPWRSKGDRKVSAELRFDSQLFRIVDHVIDSDIPEYLYGYDVSRSGQGRPEKCGAVKRLLIVSRFPGELSFGIFEYERGIYDDRGRCVALVKGRSVNNWLKGRAWLTSWLGGPVKLAYLEVSPSDHGFYIAGFSLHAKECALLRRSLLQSKLPYSSISFFCLQTDCDHVSYG